MSRSLPEARLRIRLSSKDAHYAGNLVDGARILNLFGDVATETCSGTGNTTGQHNLSAWFTVFFVYGFVPLADALIGQDRSNPEPEDIPRLSRGSFDMSGWSRFCDAAFSMTSPRRA